MLLLKALRLKRCGDRFGVKLPLRAAAAKAFPLLRRQSPRHPGESENDEQRQLRSETVGHVRWFGAAGGAEYLEPFCVGAQRGTGAENLQLTLRY